MNHEVPQPVTATRSPLAGSSPVTSAASSAARSQHSGCEAISESMPAACPELVPPAGPAAPSFAFTRAHLTSADQRLFNSACSTLLVQRLFNSACSTVLLVR